MKGHEEFWQPVGVPKNRHLGGCQKWHFSPRGHCPVAMKSLQGGLLASPAGDFPLVGGLGVVVLAGLSSEECWDPEEGERERDELAPRPLRSLPLALEGRRAPPRPRPLAFGEVPGFVPLGLGG